VAQSLLHPAMNSTRPPDWAGAVWVGAIDESEIYASEPKAVLTLHRSTGYGTARLLVRAGARIRGFVDVPVREGGISFDLLRARIGALEPGSALTESVASPTFTVIICTRDRVDQLRDALRSVLQVDYPHFDVLVVDNASATMQTRDLIAREFSTDRVRFVSEPVAGLSRARNTGLRHATGEFVAYTDDDVQVDSYWLRALASGFARGSDVDCVCGLVPSGELRSEVQAYFDGRVSWSRNLDARHYSLATPPPALPLFPFSVGEFGTGANFAIRRIRGLRMGGFDTALGVGTPTGGGEDLDFFTRVLLTGRGLVVEPAAVVWHRHRDDLAALRYQARGYGIGLGAWLTKIALNPRTAVMAVRRSPGACRKLWDKRAIGSADEVPSESAPNSSAASVAFYDAIARVGRYEVACVLQGPWRYLRQKFSGAGLLPVGSRDSFADADAGVSAP